MVKHLHLNTEVSHGVPNVVMVFINSPPDVKELVKVRVRVFDINNNQVENIVESKRENVDPDSDVYTVNFEMKGSDLNHKCSLRVIPKDHLVEKNWSV